MAEMYFVGDFMGGDVWDNADAWAASSGGIGGFGPPGSTDHAHFDGLSPDCDVINPPATSVADITMEAGFAGGTFNLNGNNLTITGTLTLAAGHLVTGACTLTTVNLVGSGAAGLNLPSVLLDIGGDADFDMASLNLFGGTIRFSGAAGTQQFTTRGKTFDRIELTGNATVVQVGDLDCLKLTLNTAAGAWDSNTYNIVAGAEGITATQGALGLSTGTHTCAGAFNVAGGVVNASGCALSLSDALAISAGTFNAPAGTMTVDGDFSVTGTGTFVHNNGMVVFANSGLISDISGAGLVTFHNLTLGASKTHRFLAGGSFAVAGAIDSNGTPLTQAVMISSIPGTYWNLNLSGTSSLADKADITDCDASAGLTVDAVDSTDGGHNLNINFGAAVLTGAVTGFAVRDGSGDVIMRGTAGVAYPVEANIVFSANTVGVLVQVAAWDITNPAAPIAMPDVLPAGAFDFVAGIPRTLADINGGALTFAPPSTRDYQLVLTVVNVPALPDYQAASAMITAIPLTPVVPPAPVPISPIVVSKLLPENRQQFLGSFMFYPELMSTYNRVGDWGSKVNEPAYMFNGFYVNSVSGVPAPAQTVEFRFVIPTGQYSLRLWAPSGPDCGILDVVMNDVSLALNQDLYDGVGNPANVILVPVVVTENGIQRLKFTVTGKNALSTNFFFRFHRFQLTPYMVGVL